MVNGNLSYNYINGKIEGEYKFYYSDGQLRYIYYYINDKKNVENKIYNCYYEFCEN